MSSADDIEEARRYPRRHVEAWMSGEISLDELCVRFGFEGQPAEFFRIEIRRAVTGLVVSIDDALAGRRPG